MAQATLENEMWSEEAQQCQVNLTDTEININHIMFLAGLIRPLTDRGLFSINDDFVCISRRLRQLPLKLTRKTIHTLNVEDLRCRFIFRRSGTGISIVLYTIENTYTTSFAFFAPVLPRRRFLSTLRVPQSFISRLGPLFLKHITMLSRAKIEA
ncbi:unnamed protein product [Thelazia callipaeda]|uniref:DUF2958 domain-containing protein n=1 Tax=Thelazia callipaeda TaxID=103827 RepID=A0A0N5CSG7_THECL|nr:unnamed protein product [Thelazia callipaeda]